MRSADQIPEEELEEMVREAIGCTLRTDIAIRAFHWLDRRCDALRFLAEQTTEHQRLN